jgi:hypothetical protein
MKNNKLFLLLMLVILVSGCIIPTQLPVLTATVTVPAVPGTLNDTPAPTPTGPGDTPAPTYTPSVTGSIPHPPLAASGPYLAYLNQAGDQIEVVLLDADGTGQKRIPYPPDAASENAWHSLSNVLSPDGKYLAYYSGSAGECFGNGTPNSANLTLNLMSLADGKTQLITKLLSQDFPNNFAKAAQELNQPDVNAEMLRNAFVCAIMQSVAWSPDGQSLAFAGQMDGLSSDLYLYDTVSNAIKRLSSGPEEVQWITWSPDGKWILDGSSYSVGEGMQYNIYVTSVDGATIKQLSRGTPQVVTSNDWLDDHRYFDTNGANGPGTYDLKLVDVNTGKTAEIWNGSYTSFAYIPYGNWVALNANTPTWPYTGSDFQTGIFLVNTDTLEQTRVNSLGPLGCCGYFTIRALGHIDEHLFLVKNSTAQNLEYLASDGTLKASGIQADAFAVTPDRLSWIAIFFSSIQVFSEDGSPIRTANLPAGLNSQGIGSIIWRQDSSGLFFTSVEAYNGNSRSPSQLYALNLTNGDPVLVDTFLAPNLIDFVWVGR